MSYKAILRPEAELDLEDAYDWYENQVKGLGEGLLAKVDDTLNLSKKIQRFFQSFTKTFVEH
jgi:hypothetical protein